MSLWTTVRQSAQGGGTFLSKKDQKKIRDPLGLSPSDKGPDKPEPTAEMLALERRQQMELDKEIEESERRAKLMARGRLGANQLLGSSPRTQTEAVTRGGTTTSTATAGGGLLGGGGGGGSTGGGGGSVSRGLIGANSRTK